MGWFKSDETPKAEEAPNSGIATADATPIDDDDDDAPASAGAAGLEPPPELADFFLLLEEHLTEPELEDIEKGLDAPKQPPPMLDQVSRGLDEPEDLKEAIAASPTLSADVLRVVNSAAFMLPAPISNIDDAVVYLGTNLVKGLVLQATVTQVMSFTTGVQQAAYMRLWRASYVASAAAQAFAQAAHQEQPSLLATRALLSTVGDLSLIAAKPDLSYLYAPKTSLFARIEAQQREIMANTAIMNSLLARKWKLPEDLRDALHHCFTPMVWAPEDNTREEATRIEDVLLFTACCLGHEVAFRGLNDATEFTLERGDAPEYFYLPAYYEALELTRPEKLFEQRKYVARVQQLIDSFSG